MRRQIFATLSLLVAAACSDETVAPPPKSPIGTLEPVPVQDGGADIVTAKERAIPDLYAKALSSSAPDGGAPFAQLAPLLNPDLVQFSSPGMPPAHEPGAIVSAHATLFGAFEDRKMTLTRVWRTPSEQTIEWVMTGTHAREWNGVAATHKAVAFKGVTLAWTKDDGSVIDMHVYFDVALLRTQLSGVGPKELLALPPVTPPTGPAQVFDQTQAGSASEQSNVAVVKSWLDAIETNKESDYVAAVADGAEIYTLENALPMKGKDDAKRYFRATHKAIGQLNTTVDSVWGVAAFAIIEYDIDGEQLGPFSWIPALAPLPARTTQLAHLDLVDICEIQDGKIVRVWRYDNPAEAISGGAHLGAVHTRAEADARP